MTLVINACDETKMLVRHRLSDQNILTLPRIHAEFSDDNTRPISTVSSVIYTTHAARVTTNQLIGFMVWNMAGVLVSWFPIREALLLKKCVMMLFIFIFKGTKSEKLYNKITVSNAKCLLSVYLEYHHACPKMQMYYIILY